MGSTLLSSTKTCSVMEWYSLVLQKVNLFSDRVVQPGTTESLDITHNPFVILQLVRQLETDSAEI